MVTPSGFLLSALSFILPRLSFVMLQMFPSSNFHVRHEKRTYFDLQLFLRIRNIYIHSTAEVQPEQSGKMQKTALAGPSGAKNPPTAPKSSNANNNQPGNTRCCFLLSDYLCHRYSSHVQHDKPSRLVLYLLPS